MLAESDQQLQSLFEQYDPSQSRDVLAEIRNVLNRRKYIQNLVSEVERTLAPNPQPLIPAPNPWKSTFTSTGHIVGIDLGTTNSLVAFMDLTGPTNHSWRRRRQAGAERGFDRAGRRKSWSAIRRASC